MDEVLTQSFIKKFKDIGFAVSRATGCWLWLGKIGDRGYGRIAVKKDGVETSIQAHRVACVAYGKHIPDGLVADHLCRNRICVNPKHIDFCTNQENIARGLKGKKWTKPSCIRGHLFTPENTRIYGRRRVCAECHKNHWKN